MPGRVNVGVSVVWASAVGDDGDELTGPIEDPGISWWGPVSFEAQLARHAVGGVNEVQA